MAAEPSDLVGEAEQYVEDVVGAWQRTPAPAYAPSREDQDKTPISVPSTETRLEAGRGLAVVDPRSMQHQNRAALAVRHVVHRYVADRTPHPATLRDVRYSASSGAEKALPAT